MAQAKFEHGEGRDRNLRMSSTAFRDEAELQRLREESEHHYLRWAVLSLIGAVIVGFLAVGLTFLH